MTKLGFGYGVPEPLLLSATLCYHPLQYRLDLSVASLMSLKKEGKEKKKKTLIAFTVPFLLVQLPISPFHLSHTTNKIPFIKKRTNHIILLLKYTQIVCYYREDKNAQIPLLGIHVLCGQL